MSSLSRYLAPARAARPNPGLVLEWRHAEGGPWLAMANAADLEDVASELASPTAPLTLGDLVRVRDPEGTVVGFSVQTDAGLVALPSGEGCGFKPDHLQDAGYDWETLWEGWDRADEMLSFARFFDVDLRLLTLAACACAETVLRYVATGENRPRQAIETARRWARGEATDRELAADRGSLWVIVGASWDAGDNAARAAAWHAARTASRDNASRDAAWKTAMTTAGAATWAVGWRSTGRELTRAAALRDMAPLVRQHLPLWRVALALAIRCQTLA